MEKYLGLYNLRGDFFNIEAVCPYYDPENQHAFTWRRDDDGVAIVSGYDPENDPSTDDDSEEYDGDLGFGFDYALGYTDDLDSGFPDYDAEVGDWTEGIPD